MAGKKTAPLDARSADKLLDLLSSDNDFRRSFKKDPRAAMQKAKIGVGADPALMASVAACCQVTRIAPKADVIKARVQLREMLLAGLSQHPIQLDAASNASLRTRK
ncbi:NHLP-related RiPP peptide [Lysobacter sp. S4-A87]|uniref:NHLP-related RiPP peptide n=1 Tax=Lysobacter sp. S4-A87 TaxID=2925843 RepID=UPI001F537D3A|nr:NHLP-related RiPP peptide [Lysobacter sp. S4-A87]UNK48117.1 NHLP-related RiPP peptide [Lysobacter sp. S4-A87]